MADKKRPSLMEMEAQRDREDAAFRASVHRIAVLLEQILELMKARELRDQFK